MDSDQPPSKKSKQPTLNSFFQKSSPFSTDGSSSTARFSKEEIAKNRSRLEITISSVRLIAKQGWGFEGHDETAPHPSDRGIFIGLIDLIGELNPVVGANLLDNAPSDRKYISLEIQKQVLGIMTDKVRRMIREEIGDSWFSIIVDEGMDESWGGQMAIILRFVSSDGVLTERFFDVKDVSGWPRSEEMKQMVCDTLSPYGFNLDKLRGLGYDGASTMSEQFSPLMHSFLNDCPYAYLVYHLGHKLHLELVSAAKQVFPAWDFFGVLDKVVKIFESSPKWNTDLQEAIRGELESGCPRRLDTACWSSYYTSAQSIIDFFDATYKVLEDVMDNGSDMDTQIDARRALEKFEDFEFVYSLHLMRAILEITDPLCQAFEEEPIDILTAVGLVSTSKTLLQELRDEGWEKLLQEVTDFCSRNEVKVPELSKTLFGDFGRYKKISMEQYFIRAIDFQLAELNSRFSESSVKLLQLSAALDPKDSFRSFSTDDICKLAVELYPADINELDLKSELSQYQIHVVQSSKFQVATLAKLFEKLVERRLDDMFKSVSRLIRLVLTSPISAATTERTISAMKLLKKDIRYKTTVDEFYADALTIAIESDLATSIDMDYVIDEFAKLTGRVAELII
ncbi:Zinc finger MYM-type protein 1 [Linum grandiflorum]